MFDILTGAAPSRAAAAAAADLIETRKICDAVVYNAYTARMPATQQY